MKDIPMDSAVVLEKAGKPLQRLQLYSVQRTSMMQSNAM